MTLNLNGGISSPSTSSTSTSQLLSSPKLCNLPSLIPPLTPTPVNLDKNTNKNESVTVTHFSDLHGGVVEKISVPVTTGSSFENGTQKLPAMEFTMARANNNPFAEEIMTTTIISSSTTTTSPTIKISTNPFLRSSFNANERIDKITDKSLKISFSIGANSSNGSNGINPFDISDISDEMNGENKTTIEDANGNDDVDNENNLSSISSVNLKIDANNEINITKIQMDSLPLSDKIKANGGTKKVCWSIIRKSRKFAIINIVVFKHYSLILMGVKLTV